MSTTDLRFRQVHLDFHTSELIEGIGADFDPDEFAGTLEKARVNSVTCFARCHHGYIYFDTKAFPERRHPHLTCNLLKEQIEACHARDIRVPIYTTVQWDHYTAEHHPEWLCVTEDGRLEGTPPYKAGFKRVQCLNSPYTEFLKTHVNEILTTFPVDGLFFDIVQSNDCSCHRCRSSMMELSLDPSNPEARRCYGEEVVDSFKREMTHFVRDRNDACSIFYNSGHIGPQIRTSASAYTHFELECLASGGWGYMHFPFTIRYARTLGLDCMGMTGKFHTIWGDFHSFKSHPALEFECFRMQALNAKCSIGDQLHPRGKICSTTYDLIGSIYTQIEAKEPWCENAKPLSEIGLLSPEESTSVRIGESVVGAVRILEEGGHQFDVLDSKSDLSPYSLLILPDEIPVSEKFAQELRDYLTNGGSLIASYRSGLKPTGEGFALKEFGIDLVGDAPYSPDFILPEGEMGQGLPRSEHVMYLRALEVEPRGAEILCRVIAPYFNRTFRHFCSHQHTPSSGEPAYPGALRTGTVIYFAHPLFTIYGQKAPLWCKTLVLNAVRILLPDPLLRLKAPSTTVATLNSQDEQNRWVLHLLHYIPERRGKELDTIEDVIPLHNIEASVRVERKVRSISTVPDGHGLSFHQNGDRAEFVVPRIQGHQMICIEF
jgi:hypothetical protein